MLLATLMEISEEGAGVCDYVLWGSGGSLKAARPWGWLDADSEQTPCIGPAIPKLA